MLQLVHERVGRRERARLPARGPRRAAGDHVRGRRDTRRQARHLDVPVAVHGERRLVRLDAARAGESEPVGDLRGTQVRRVQGAVRVEHLRVPHGDRGAGRPTHRQPVPAAEVLTEVEHPDPWSRLGDRPRPELLLHGHPVVHLGHERRLRAAPHEGRRPAPVVEPGTVPTGHREPGVVGLAVVEVVGADRAARHLPRVVGAHRGARAVGEGQPQLRGVPRLRAVLLAAGDADTARVPAVAEQRAQRVGALADLSGHVEHLVLQPLVVVGPARREHVRADLRTVEPGLVQTERGGEQPSARDRLVDRETLAQNRRRLA